MESSTNYPPVDALLPHAGPAVLLDSVLHYGADIIECGVVVSAERAFGESFEESFGTGRVPSWIGVEYLAQAAAAHTGLRRCREGFPVRVGFLLSTRRLELEVPWFAEGEALRVAAKRVWVGSGMAIFEGSVRREDARGESPAHVAGGEADVGAQSPSSELVRGRINVYLPDEVSRPAAEGSGDGP